MEAEGRSKHGSPPLAALGNLWEISEMTDFTPCPKTYEDGIREGIRRSIEALPVESIPTMDQPWSAAWNACRSDATKRLEALLPDPAEELARDWREHDTWAGGFDTPLRRETAERFARWLINQGKVRP